MSDGFVDLEDASKRVVAETDQLVNVGKPDRFNRPALDFLAFAG